MKVVFTWFSQTARTPHTTIIRVIDGGLWGIRTKVGDLLGNTVSKANILSLLFKDLG